MERSKKGISGYYLKWIAVISMLVDHSYKILYADKNWLLAVIAGRLAFPVFCFLLVEGFHYTRDVKKYAVRLGIFAIISEIPFDLAVNGQLLEFKNQNVFFTLLLGVLLMQGLEKNSGRQEWKRFALVFIAGLLAILLRTDYSVVGILMIFGFYTFRMNQRMNEVFHGVLNLLSGYPQVYGILALLPIHMYNGTKGKSMKYFFYLFYPLHLLALYFLKSYIG